jgi:hypothetical protein
MKIPVRPRIRSPLFVIIYVVIAVPILHSECLILESKVALVAFLYQSFNSISRKSPAVIFPGINLINFPLGLNYDAGFFCTERDGYLSFSTNRKCHKGQYAVL